MKKTISINSLLLFLSIVLLCACSGSRKYFKAGERLEKQGLTGDAAEFYLEAVQRKNTNTDARVKLKEVGQKYVSYLSSEFYRNYNLDQTEASLESFEKLKSFTTRSETVGVSLTYPSDYDDNYKTAIEKYCDKNYTQGVLLLKSKKYEESLKYLQNVAKYKPEYKKVAQLKTVVVCEPLYQSAIVSIENKNYNQAITSLSSIQQNITDTYKDSKELLEMCLAQQKKGILLFKSSSTEKNITDYLFDNFSGVVAKDLETAYLIGNGPFTSLPKGDIGSNIDLIQSIKKATGADYFYTFEITDKQSQFTGPSRSLAKSYQKITYKTNDGRVVTEYKPAEYYQITGNRRYAYQFKYTLINAVSNQVVSSQNITINMQDNMEYNEFIYAPQSSIDNYFPYNPTYGFGGQYNVQTWRNLFSAKKTIKSEQELAELANQDAIKNFKETIINYIQ